MEIVSVVAILISPAIAVWVSMLVQKRKDARQDKMAIFSTLMATRDDRLQVDNVRALNMIDLVFHDSPQVRSTWREYYDMLTNSSYNDNNGWILRDRKYRELLDVMAKALGYNVNLGDIERAYTPHALGEQRSIEIEIRDELVRVLRASQCLGVPISTTQKSAAKPEKQ